MQEETPEVKVITVTVRKRITPKLQQASRDNGAKAKSVVTSEEQSDKLKKAWDKRGRAADKCNCGRTDGTHAYKCPAYFAWKQKESREKKARQLAQAGQDILPMEGERAA